MDRQDMIMDAIAEIGTVMNETLDRLLDKLMPRVLTLEEVLEWKDSVWVEERNGSLYVALIKRIFYDRRVIAVCDYSHYYESSSCEYGDYGRLKRFWTMRPTPEQQEMEEWKETEG